MSAQQQEEGGWPLRLRPLVNVNVRASAGLTRNLNDSYGSISFSTLVSGSPTSASDSSSSDSESTGSPSIFPDRSITLGSLLGITTSILEISSRSLRNRRRTASTRRNNNPRASSKLWLLSSLCPNSDHDAEAAGRRRRRSSNSATRSLAHFLQVERRARAASASNGGADYSYEIDGFGDREINPLFSNGRIAPPPPLSSEHSSRRRRIDKEFPLGSGMLLVFPCCIGGAE